MTVDEVDFNALIRLFTIVVTCLTYAAPTCIYSARWEDVARSCLLLCVMMRTFFTVINNDSDHCFNTQQLEILLNLGPSVHLGVKKLKYLLLQWYYNKNNAHARNINFQNLGSNANLLQTYLFY